MKIKGNQPGDNNHVGPLELIEGVGKAFEETPSVDRPEFAAQWLEAYLQKTHRSEQAIEVISRHFSPQRSLFRTMMLSIPKEHSVFIAPPYSERNSVHTYLRQFFNWGTPLIDLDPIERRNTSLVRDMWLQPDIQGRREAMLSLADKREVAGLHTNLEWIMREIAWDIAYESGADDEIVAAATKLTLETHRDCLGVNSTHRIVMSISVLLARCEYWSALYASISGADIRNTISANFISCIETLEFIYANPKYKVPVDDAGAWQDAAKASVLADWLPDHRSHILLLDSMGVLPLDIIRQIKSERRPGESGLELPMDVGGGVLC